MIVNMFVCIIYSIVSEKVYTSLSDVFEVIMEGTLYVVCFSMKLYHGFSKYKMVLQLQYEIVFSL